MAAKPRASRNTAKRTYKKRSPKVATKTYVDKKLNQTMGEKKHYGPVFLIDTEGAGTIPVGLSNGTNAEGGGAIVDLRPSIDKGTDRDDRTGNSVRLHSMCLKINLAGQSTQSMNSILSFEIYQVNGNRPYNGTDRSWNILGKDLFKQDPLTLLYPPDAVRNPNYMKQFKLIRRVIKRTPQDNGGSSNFVYNFKIPIKFKNYRLRWDDGVNQLTQLLLIVRANNGNRSVATATLTGQAQLGLNTAVNTGFVFNVAADYFFYDN